MNYLKMIQDSYQEFGITPNRICHEGQHIITKTDKEQLVIIDNYINVYYCPKHYKEYKKWQRNLIFKLFMSGFGIILFIVILNYFW